MANLQYHPLMVLMQLGGFVSLGVAAYAVRYMRQHGRSYLVGSVGLLAFNNAVFLFAATAKMASPTLGGSLFWYRFEFFGYTANPGVAVILALAYTNREHWLTRRRVATFAVIPTAILLAILWNPNDLMITEPTFVQVGDFSAFEHEITFGHGLQTVWGFGAFVSAIVIVGHAVLADRVPRLQGTLLVLTFLLPIVLAGLKTSGIYPPGGKGINVTPAVGGVSLTLVAIAILRYRLFELPPVGRQRAIGVMREGYVLVDSDGAIADTNPAARALLTGDSDADLTTHTVSAFVPVADSLGDQETDTFTVDDRVVQVTCSEISNDGEYVGRVLLLFDITERRERERELERKERIIEHVPVGVYRNTPGPEGEALYMNETLVEMAGADSKAELREYSVSDLYVDPDEREAFSQKLLDEGSVSNEELRMQTVDGEKRWMLVSNARVEEDGQVYFEGAIQDITERKEAQQELERTRDRIQSERDSKEAIRQLLLQTSTDQELAATVCRLVVDAYGYAAAWVVSDYDPDTPGETDVISIAEYGDDHGFRADDAGPTSRVVENATPVAVTAADDDPVSARLDACDLYALRSVPLTHGGITYGALTVLRAEPETEFGRELVGEFADAIAFKRQVSRQQEALAADTVLELDVRIAGDHVLATLAAALPTDASLSAHELQGDDEGEVTYLVPTGDPATIESVAADIEGVRETTVLAEDEPVVEIRVDPPAFGTVLGRYGGVIQSITASGGHVDLTVQFPRRTAVSEVVEAIRAHWPDAVMRSRTEQTVEATRPALFESLTRKQAQALRAATLAGFFDRPQRATATEVAETLDVSRSTFLRHLRTAEQKVFETAFEQDSAAEKQERG